MRKLAALPDTNFILRYLLRDIEDQFREAETFFEDVRSGKTAALIAEFVLVECLYILTKYYGVPRTAASSNLTALLQYKGVANPDKAVLVKSLRLFAETPLDPVDCILAAQSALAGHRVMTFDKELKRVIKQTAAS
ncbi:PIN domain-containing protein [Geomonas sp. Red32]|uniref:PIN domain-containing protein n=1 Tax=Geomonas sp. Red32 TaxID=2912856 RepID=UPI00202D01BD|nr:PIN domain-containing protein [Geomonas sp. Red32]MCM0081124.1 PIN domain-containing protein [Geomonas sp. Red32]